VETASIEDVLGSEKGIVAAGTDTDINGPKGP